MTHKSKLATSTSPLINNGVLLFGPHGI